MGRQMKSIVIAPLIKIAVGVAFLLLQFFAAHELIAQTTGSFDLRMRGTITRVVDGDTVIFRPLDSGNWDLIRAKAAEAEKNYQRDLNLNSKYRNQDKTFTIRVGNIDTPESRHPDPSRNTPEGKIASAYAKELLTNSDVSVICWEIGFYGRAICSIWNSDFEFGSHMIRKNFSDYITRFGNHPVWHQMYLDAERSR